MDPTAESEDVVIQVKDKLQRDGVKLWLPPYHVENNGSSEDALKNLALEYSKSLNLPFDACLAAVRDLQSCALENLKQRDRFKASGLATLKIKVLNASNPPKLLTQECLLSIYGADFKSSLGSALNTPADRIKLICNGIVIKDGENLSSQGLKNGSQVLAIILSETPLELQEAENQIRELEAVKADTQLLTSDDGYYMQLEDQTGNAINIPQRERKSLILAMTLHEKGRSALKKEDYARALLFFLDADKEFSQCNSNLLNSVDNFALLDLDIAWCYLCLQSFAHLPEAHVRLKRCEERFHKSYGTNLERLLALKGTIGNESALFMRLHLLQAIVLYHQNKRPDALKLLKAAENELVKLKVNESSLMTLVELGFSPAEARLGLRATNGDVNLAANYITENRRNRSESRRKALADKILEREKKKLGKCADGKQYVDPNFVKLLVNMGFSKEAARVALQQTNNIISDSVQYMQEHPQAGPSKTKSKEMLALIDDLIPELEAAGFDAAMARLALRKYDADIMKAAEELLANGGVVLDYDDTDEAEDSSAENARKKMEEDKKKEEAFARLSEDIPMIDDDHLDLTLQAEEEFLRRYLDLLSQDK